MILQNISKAIREQNYYAVALEFVIVIAGVVIGFQINAWNEARQASARNAVLVASLADDFRRIEADSLFGLQITATRIERINTFIVNGAAVCDQLSDRELLEQIVDIYYQRGPVARSQTLVELQGAGGLIELESEELRVALTQYQRSQDGFLRNSNVGLDSENYAALLSTATLAQATDPAAPPAQIIARVRDQCRSPAVLASIASYRRAQESAYYWHNEVLTTARSALVALGHAPSGQDAAPLALITDASASD